MLLFIATLACAPEEEDEPEAVEDTGFTSQDVEHCTSVTIEHDAAEPDPPRVGDRWTILPKCDGQRVNAGIVLRLDPPEWGRELEEGTKTLVEFVMEGRGTIHVQYGQDKGQLEVDVLPAEDSG